MRKWLKDLREARDLTMKDMGHILSISESYYCSIERGNRQKDMNIGLAADIAAVFDISMENVAQLEAEWKNQAAAYPDRTAAGHEGRASSSAAREI